MTLYFTEPLPLYSWINLLKMSNNDPNEGSADEQNCAPMKGKEEAVRKDVSGRTFWDLIYVIIFNRALWMSIAAFLFVVVTLSLFGLSEISLQEGKLNIRIGKSEAQITAELKQQEQEKRTVFREERLNNVFNELAGAWLGVRRTSGSWGDHCSWVSRLNYKIEVTDYSASQNYGGGNLLINVERTLTTQSTPFDNQGHVEQCIRKAGVSRVGTSIWDVHYDFEFSFMELGNYAKLNLVQSERCGDSCRAFDAELRLRPNGELLFTRVGGLDFYQFRLSAE